MAKYTWNRGPVPSSLRIKQVYGIVFTDDLRILLRLEDGVYKLSGGKPEANENYEQTLRREYIEELNVELDHCFYLGYLLVEEGHDKYAQVRMIATITNINKNHVDPDTGKQYGRLLVNAYDAKHYLRYRDKAGNTMLDDAINAAKSKYAFSKIEQKAESV